MGLQRQQKLDSLKFPSSSNDRQPSCPSHDPQDMGGLPSASLSAQRVSDGVSSIHPMGGTMDKLLRNKDTVEQFSNILGVIAHLAQNMRNIVLRNLVSGVELLWPSIG
ncbi:hypothetical protein LOZ58_005993 [Ophidiomyces ophidiicola]|nr:hypothetical protein LOZ58_005993 [Ophidiomyces ophidiicola]